MEIKKRTTKKVILTEKYFKKIKKIWASKLTINVYDLCIIINVNRWKINVFDDLQSYFRWAKIKAIKEKETTKIGVDVVPWFLLFCCVVK